ncbi:protein CutA homolog isoform X2 [Phaenicophaeus curvirostris]|uniref:protein CutA homolog isoform X2 n=1 Tax=Phaenicophaeus curvirostris TaxID=33595 RepID=UPI0037F0A15E
MKALALALVTPLLLQGLGRRLVGTMASRDPPGDPPVPNATSGDTSGDAGDTYVPGSLSAAFVTCPNVTVATELARSLVQKRLAACVNIVPHVTSIYEWQGKLEEDSEVLMMIKTRSSKIPALAEFVRSAHPYEVPEVVALPVTQGSVPYLRWALGNVPPLRTPKRGGGPQKWGGGLKGGDPKNKGGPKGRGNPKMGP